MRLWFSLLLCVVGASSARADDTLAVLRAAGMMGTWSESCAAGPSKGNWFVTFYVGANGGARRKGARGGGADPDLDGAVDSAERLAPTMIRLRLRNDDVNWGTNNGKTYDIVADISNRHFRSLSVALADGTFAIKDGKIVSSGKPAANLQKCN